MINYYLITKPGIVAGNLITLVAGFLLASQGSFNILLFLASFIGLALIMASACIFNNYIDRHLDEKMERTKDRAFAKGTISFFNALCLAVVLFVLGEAILWRYTNFLASGAAAIGFFIYVVIYSLWKSRTIYATAIGSVAGAIPPLVGYFAAGDRFDAGAVILFLMLVLWQMPHFFSIALYRYDDYQTANIPAFPLVKGIVATKIRMLIYIAAFIGVGSLLTIFGYTGKLYLIVFLTSSILWLVVGLAGFVMKDYEAWSRHMFGYSLVLITLTCAAMSYS